MCGAPRFRPYLLVLRTPPLLLPAHLLLVVPALLPLLLLPQLLLPPLLLWGNKRTTLKDPGTLGLRGESSREGWELQPEL